MNSQDLKRREGGKVVSFCDSTQRGVKEAQWCHGVTALNEARRRQSGVMVSLHSTRREGGTVVSWCHNTQRGVKEAQWCHGVTALNEA